MVKLKINNLTVNYGNKNILDNISITLTSGKIYGLVGSNGTGKSTFIKAIFGINKKTNGDIFLNEEKINKNILKKFFSYVPQRSEIDLNFPINIFDLVLMGIESQKKILDPINENDKNKVNNILEKMELTDLRNRLLSDVSGGQRQRALVARSLIQDANVYILDEPFIGIDDKSETIILSLLKEMKKKNKLILVAHHDLNKIERYFDDLIVFKNKKINEQTPKNYVAEILREAR
ncbi:MAG: ABC transporter ATP-binding protein [Lactobacillaceae bacterium]|jgi:ABC-type Mn2+/Zn2+ transport system ATPase subunit|nr:ABC transporter ATP-binding protein [Lactobacillaceae bacterium]